jgi:hypothetical protein
MIESKESLTGNIISKQTIKGDLNVAEIKVLPELENLEVTPTKQKQEYNHETSDGYNNVIVNPIPDEYIIPEGTLPITENTTYDVTNYARVSASVQPVIPDEYIIPTGTLDITKNGTYDVKQYSEATVNVAGSSEPVIEPDYITDGLVAWWEGCDDVDENGYWRSRVGDDYIINSPNHSSNSLQGSPLNAFYTIKSEKAYQNNMIYGLVTNEDYYYQGYTIEFVGKARNGANNAAMNSNVAAPLLAFDKGSGPMISNFGSSGYFACVNQYQNSGMPKLFDNCYGKRYKYAITLDKLVPRGTSSGECQVSYSLNDSQWYQKNLTNVNSPTEKGAHMTVLTYHWDTYKSNSEVNSIRVYNRKLTEDELKHNYEIDKARFNLDIYEE